MGKPNLNQNRQKVNNILSKNNLARGNLQSVKKAKDAIEEPVAVPEIVESTQEIYDKISSLAENYRNTDSLEDKQAIEGYLANHNMEFHEDDYKPITEAKQKIARIVFNGGLEKPLEWERKKMSYCYKNAIKHHSKASPRKAEEYDLSNSTVWQVFEQVPEFKEKAYMFKEALANARINPDNVADLGVYDFADMMYEKFKTPYSKGYLPLFEGAKKKNTKRFIMEHGEEFKAKLLEMPGTDKDYVDILINKMRTKGTTDMSKEVDPWTGQPFENQPIIDVHHIINIKDAGQFEAEGKSFLDVNKYENMCWMEKKAHEACHLTDRPIFVSKDIDPVTGKRKIKTIQRARPLKGAKCCLGFKANMHIMEKVEKVVEMAKSILPRSNNNYQNKMSDRRRA